MVCRGWGSLKNSEKIICRDVERLAWRSLFFLNQRGSVSAMTEGERKTMSEDMKELERQISEAEKSMLQAKEVYEVKIEKLA